jgi:tetratricopeptide (TPR) repeat protein
MAALRLSAAALDQQRQTSAHSRAIAAGLQALDEAEDLAPAVAAIEPATLASITESHRTPRLSSMPDDETTPAQHLQNYLAFAQQQLSSGAGDLQPAASALYALGKLEMHESSGEIGSIAVSRAAVFLQAALEVNPRHALAANELGVLLSRHGRLDEAKAAFLHSVRLAPQAVTWRNLAVVHKGLGEADLANRAAWEAGQLAAPTSTAAAGGQPTKGQPNSSAGGQTPHVEWLEPGDFARTARASDGAPVAVQAPIVSSHPHSAGASAAANREASNTSFAFPWWRKTANRQ